MTDRIKEICLRLPRASVFADVGCDHGYCTQYALQNGLCERAYISDISAPSLKKAEALLKNEIAAKKCIPVCADGLQGIPERCDCVLIAGMGGEEIVKIFSDSYIPEKFVLQPMKNADKVRLFLIKSGCGISFDGTFFAEGKAYDLIEGTAHGTESYTECELFFGRDNIKNPSAEFLKKLRRDREKLRALVTCDMQEKSRGEVLERLRLYEEITNVIERDL